MNLSNEAAMKGLSLLKSNRMAPRVKVSSRRTLSILRNNYNVALKLSEPDINSL